ncbi:hypothetical protein CUR178_06890 [Leishmania enriettii]|uniref:Uncharacterized protein n=1 Tax=Leishmania enriettii TaxID=5663 RepID=A0A836KZU1_LEIEN|nr:hypothetical protein CUR178_06890 [Leishmania enriettii]
MRSSNSPGSLSSLPSHSTKTTSTNTPSAAATAPGAQRLAPRGIAHLFQLSTLPSSIVGEEMDNLLSTNDICTAASPWAKPAFASILGEAKGLPPPQQEAPSQTFSEPALSAQPSSAPFPGVVASAFFSASVGGGAPQCLAASAPQQGRLSYIIQSCSNQSRKPDQITASSIAQAFDPNTAGVTDASLAGARGSSSILPTALSASQTEEGILSHAIFSCSNSGEACGDNRPRPSHQTHAHGSASFFSMPLSSMPSSPLSPSPAAAEEFVLGQTSFHLPTASPSLTDDDDEYDHTMHGQVEFVKQLCNGTGDKDDGGSGESAQLSGSCEMSQRSPPQCLQQPTAVYVKVGSLSDLSAAPGLRAAVPAAPPLSKFRPLSIATNGSNEYSASRAASAAGAGIGWDAPMRCGSFDGSTRAHSQASSGNFQAPLWLSQGMAVTQQEPTQQAQRVHRQQQWAPFDRSPLLVQTCPRTARSASAEVAARGSSQQNQSAQHLQASASSQSSFRPYSVSAASGVATLLGPTLRGSDVCTTSPAPSFHAANSYYAGSGASPSGCPPHPIMLLPSSSDSSSTVQSAQAQHAMRVPAPTFGAHEATSASPYAATHVSGGTPSSSKRPSTPTAMAAGGCVSAVTLFYVGAPTAFAGFPSTAAASLMNASSSSVSANSCPVGLTQPSGPERSTPSPHYVYLQARPPAKALESPPMCLQQYAGNIALQLPNVGVPAAPKQVAPAALHARTSSPVVSATVANLPSAVGTEAFSPGIKPAGLICPGIRPGVPAANTELTRKQVNVHGAMATVLSYHPYNENAPPAPTAHIVTRAGSASSSILTPSLSEPGWSARPMNSSAECDLGGSWRSTEGAKRQGAGEMAASVVRDATPALANAPVLPVFIQMFPCELLDRVGLLNRVIEATCGRDAGLVQSFESRSETSFVAHLRTNNVWELIYKLRCRVLMDRFGFWYAADIDQYVRMKEYCEGVRRLPQQTRHFQTDGLPCMPLVVELSRSVDRSLVTENTGPRCFDELVPIAAVDRHRTRMQGSSSVHGGHTSAITNGTAMGGSGASTAGGAVFLNSVGGDVRSRQRGLPAFLLNESHMMMAPLTVPGLPGDSYRVDGCFAGNSAPLFYADPHFLPPPSTT